MLINKYRYGFGKDWNPYWQAFSQEMKSKLAEHDQLELRMIKARKLDFELVDAWTRNDSFKNFEVDRTKSKLQEIKIQKKTLIN